MIDDIAILKNLHQFFLRKKQIHSKCAQVNCLWPAIYKFLLFNENIANNKSKK